LLVCGDAGVGKTALLDVAALHAEAAGTRVVRAVGAEFEAELGFSGLNLVLHPLLDGLPMLPPLHRQALSVALGLDAGSPSDRLVVSNAVLALLRGAAVTRPLLVVVDDLPYLDRAGSLVLASAVRRLAGTGAGFLAALRTESESFFDRAGLSSHELAPLDRAAATSLLKLRFPALTPRVRERLIADAQGRRRGLRPGSGACHADAELRSAEHRHRAADARPQAHPCGIIPPQHAAHDRLHARRQNASMTVGRNDESAGKRAARGGPRTACSVFIKAEN
jgi:hypothetical protein